MREILIQHSYITDCRFCDKICFYNTELNVSVSKENKKRKGKRKLSIGTVYEVKQDKYIHVYRAHWMQCIFVSLRFFRSVFLSNPAISSIFLNLPIPKRLGYLVGRRRKSQVANVYYISAISINTEYYLKLPNMVTVFWLWRVSLRIWANQKRRWNNGRKSSNTICHNIQWRGACI